MCSSLILLHDETLDMTYYQTLAVNIYRSIVNDTCYNLQCFNFYSFKTSVFSDPSVTKTLCFKKNNVIISLLPSIYSSYLQVTSVSPHIDF